MSAESTFSVASARAADDENDLGRWVADFLASDGSDNAVLGTELRREQSVWIGPVQVSFDRLHRLAGPPDQPTLDRLTSDDLETVEEMADSVEDGWDPSPLIATWSGDHLVLEDGNHRVEGLRRAGLDAYWTVIGFDSDDQRDQYLRQQPDA